MPFSLAGTSISRTAMAFMLIALVFTVYSNTLDNDFVWDDLCIIRNNPAIRSASGIPEFFTRDFFGKPRAGADRPYWRPVTLISFMFDYHFWRDNPFGCHLTNLLLHATNAVLVLCLLSLSPVTFPIALPASLIFALHPVQTNATAYISGRTDLLATAFLLFATLIFTRAQLKSSGRMNLAGFICCLLLSMMAKETALAAPLFLLLWAWASAPPSNRSIRPWIAAAFTAVAGYFLLRRLVGMLPSATTAATSPPHLLLVMKSVLIYAKIIFFPVGLHMERFLGFSQLDSLIAISAFAAAMMIRAVLAALKGNRAARFLILALCAFLPASNIIPLYPDIARTQLFLGEQFLYLPLIGIASAAALLMGSLARRLRSGLPAVRILGAVALICFSLLSYRHNEYWKDELTFYGKTVEFNPGSVRMTTNLGLLYLRNWNYRKALDLLSLVARQNPESSQARRNLAMAYLKSGDRAKAKDELERALELDPMDPITLDTMGELFFKDGDIKNAARYFEKACDIIPAYQAACINLALALREQKEWRGAELLLLKVLARDPGSFETRLLLASVYELSGRTTEAHNQYGLIAREHPELVTKPPGGIKQ